MKYLKILFLCLLPTLSVAEINCNFDNNIYYWPQYTDKQKLDCVVKFITLADGAVDLPNNIEDVTDFVFSIKDCGDSTYYPLIKEIQGDKEYGIGLNIYNLLLTCFVKSGSF